jgi:REP element-mobilizing transposase RayT
VNTLHAGVEPLRPLTPRQGCVLEFVENHLRQNGYPPTLREIGQAVGLVNVNAVRGHLEAIEKKGYIAKDPDKARSIRVIHSPSPLSLLKRRLHEAFRTDEGVLHRVVYGLAWATWERTAYFEGARRDWMDDALRREATEHGWRLVEKQIASDHLVLVVEVWPNHSPETVVRRFQAAGQRMWRCHPRRFPGKHLWAPGYVATTDLAVLDDLRARLLHDVAERRGTPR